MSKENTFDYPAKYKGVIGVGVKKHFTAKKNDVAYRNSNLIVISDGVKFYFGNSYLTPYTMLKENRM